MCVCLNESAWRKIPLSTRWSDTDIKLICHWVLRLGVITADLSDSSDSHCVAKELLLSTNLDLCLCVCAPDMV